uniref:Uncharacterized protein n=1 Tax=viral metagenome TaxID=1070528 RepID=A0A6C0BQS2_9ZZZZ
MCEKPPPIPIQPSLPPPEYPQSPTSLLGRLQTKWDLEDREIKDKYTHLLALERQSLNTKIECARLEFERDKKKLEQAQQEELEEAEQARVKLIEACLDNTPQHPFWKLLFN